MSSAYEKSSSSSAKTLAAAIERPRVRRRLLELAAACLIPLWFAAAGVIFQVYEDKRTATDQLLQAQARALAGAINGELAQYQAILQTLSLSDDLVDQRLSTFYAMAKEVAVRRGAISIVLSDNRAQQIVNTLLPFDTPPRQRSIPDIVAKVISGGRPVVSNAWEGPISHRLQFAVEVPVFRTGKATFSLGINIPADSLNHHLQKLRLPSGSIAVVYDGAGRIIARQPSDDAIVGRLARPATIESFNAHTEGMMDMSNFDGVDRIAAFHHDPSTGWSVLVGQPRAVVNLAAQQWLYAALSWAAVISLLGIAAAWWISRHIAAPLTVLAEQARNLGSGKPIHLAKAHFAEAEQLAEALDASGRLLALQSEERDRAMRALEQFTEILAHHLQEPVRLQLTYTSQFRRSLEGVALPSAAQSALGYIVNGAERLRHLLRDVQTYLSLSEQKLSGAVADGNSALAAARFKLDGKITATHAQIATVLLPHFAMDQHRLVDIFAALLDNSITYFRPGESPQIQITCSLEGAWAIVRFKDNGIGIPKQFHERVFNVFERLESDSRAPNTGIGLALVRRIVDLHHGRVWIESGPDDVGTIVVLRLPLAEG